MKIRKTEKGRTNSKILGTAVEEKTQYSASRFSLGEMQLKSYFIPPRQSALLCCGCDSLGNFLLNVHLFIGGIGGRRKEAKNNNFMDYDRTVSHAVETDKSQAECSQSAGNIIRSRVQHPRWEMEQGDGGNMKNCPCHAINMLHTVHVQ